MNVAVSPGPRSPTGTKPLGLVSRLPTTASAGVRVASASAAAVVIGVVEVRPVTLTSLQVSCEELCTRPRTVSGPDVGVAAPRLLGVSALRVTSSGSPAVPSSARGAAAEPGAATNRLPASSSRATSPARNVAVRGRRGALGRRGGSGCTRARLVGGPILDRRV